MRGASSYQVELTGSNGRHYCSANLWPGDHYSVNFKNGRVPSIDGTESCSNDDVYFFNIKSALAGTHFALYDSPDASTGDDWVEVNVKRDIIDQTGPISVESNVDNDDYQVVFHHKNGLKGKVSAMQVTVGNPS
ncbi:hypothetical protein THUN1379_31110 [Paludibacterium sp. THUN1379]|uniref:hypothetical protein n=1 Tax=Paludibacterium sp. THUN1379 TaxID=3112107 RepID=UPI00308532B8|nr:hypothetical protein THUN1379_31110 [Paludibacterium sp. THUN1379]